MRATDLAHLLLEKKIQPGDLAIDATVGNGHDTLFLAKLVGPTGNVIGFDIQQSALEAATIRVQEHPQVKLIQCGHEFMSRHIPPSFTRLSAVMFNLGYLPHTSDEQRAITTTPQTSMMALQQALSHLGKRGLITIILYSGHEGGDLEAETIRDYAKSLPDEFAVTHYARLNAKRPAPELIVIERMR